MTTPELQLVLEAISKLGEAGKEAFIWWLVMDKAVPALAWSGVALAGLALIGWAIHRLNPKEPE